MYAFAPLTSSRPFAEATAPRETPGVEAPTAPAASSPAAPIGGGTDADVAELFSHHGPLVDPGNAVASLDIEDPQALVAGAEKRRREIEAAHLAEPRSDYAQEQCPAYPEAITDHAPIEATGTSTDELSEELAVK